VKICQIVPSLEARHGGPSKSVLLLATALAQLGHDVDLLATHPGTALEPVQEGPLRILQFRRDRPECLCVSAGLREHLQKHAYDCIHHHSLWLRTLHYASRAAQTTNQPMVISPRGMMSEWSWQHRRWKKWLASNLVHPGALIAARGWHATSSNEADDIRRRGFRQPICIAPNGVEQPTLEEQARSREAWTQLCPTLAGRRVALFYSRFHSKKRLLELIGLWNDTAPKDWLLLIAGIPQEYSVEEVTDYVRRHSSESRILVIDGSDRPPPYGVASLFLLPSHTENFGMVIAEAMAWGVPVLVTDTTPWTEVSKQDVGWCVPWDAYRDTLRLALAEPADQLVQRGARARDWVLAQYSWAKSARELLEFYGQL
jgi:glycosyltransferase involved in cell wall biosynthesis